MLNLFISKLFVKKLFEVGKNIPEIIKADKITPLFLGLIISYKNTQHFSYFQFQ